MYAQTVRAGAGESYFKSANGAGELFLDHRPVVCALRRESPCVWCRANIPFFSLFVVVSATLEYVH